MKKLTLIIGLLISLSTVGGIVIALDSRWAKTETVEQLSMRLDQKIVTDRISQLQERIWSIEDRYEGKTMPDDIKDVLRRLRQEISDLERQLES